MQYLRNAQSDFDPVFFYLFVFSSSVTYVKTEKMVFTPPLALNWSFFVQFWHYFFSKCLFFKENRMVTITKLNYLQFSFWFFPQFLLQGLTWAVLHVWTQNYLQNVGTCPGCLLQLLTRNHFFQSERTEPPPLKFHW